MRSAESARGEIVKYLGVVMLSVAGLMMSYFFPTHTVSKALGIEGVPCLGLGLLSGILYVFWIALARELFGRGWGVAVSVLTVSLLLLNGPWYGVVNPPYFGAFGFVSFLLMGVLTDFVNGGVGSLACLLVNWIAFYVFRGVHAPLTIGIAVLVATFVSGYVFDVLAKKVAELL